MAVADREARMEWVVETMMSSTHQRALVIPDLVGEAWTTAWIGEEQVVGTRRLVALDLQVQATLGGTTTDRLHL